MVGVIFLRGGENMLYNKVGHLDASGNYVYVKNSDRIAKEKRQYLSTTGEKPNG